MTARKYTRGAGFATVNELVEWILGGNLTYGLGPRPLNEAFMRSQQLNTLVMGLRYFRRAEPVGERVEVEP